MRLDRYLSALELFSRRQSAFLIRKWFFQINHQLITSRDYALQECDLISREDQELIVKTHVTLLINKPTWYISSDIDEYGRPSYKQLLVDYPYTPLLHIAGRLDVDTEGLIIASSDGQLVHKIISPKHHLPKHYLVTTRDPIDEMTCVRLAQGVVLDDGYHTLPAKVTILDSLHLELILIEGKYHQVKRMLLAVGNEVVYLQRTAIGPRTIDGLVSGTYKELSPHECVETLGITLS